MKYYFKGLLLGIGMLTPILLVFVIVVSTNLADASTFLIKDAPNNKSIQIDYNTLTKYIWVDNDPPAISEMKNNIESVQQGGIVVGITTWSPDGIRTVDVPIYKDGYIITFKNIPLSTDIDKLDLQMSIKNLNRIGGKTIVDAVQKIQSVTGIK